MRPNEINIEMVMIPQTHKYFLSFYSEARYFVDEVAYDQNGNIYTNNIGSYKTEQEAKAKAEEVKGN